MWLDLLTVRLLKLFQSGRFAASDPVLRWNGSKQPVGQTWIEWASVDDTYLALNDNFLVHDDFVVSVFIKEQKSEHCSYCMYEQKSLHDTNL